MDNGDNSVDIWDFEYPSYYKGDEKKAFEQKVIDHFYFRQIGHETVGRFKHAFRTKVQEIMPYYVQLYESEALMKGIDDPFGNVDIVETYERETSGTGSSHSTGNDSNNSERRFSDTPQGSIDNLDDYMSEAERINASGNSSLTAGSESTGRESYTLTKKGNQGVNTYAHDMKELRETFLNIDMQVISDLECLFLRVY